jgi:hypothetical protein
MKFSMTATLLATLLTGGWLRRFNRQSPEITQMWMTQMWMTQTLMAQM